MLSSTSTAAISPPTKNSAAGEATTSAPEEPEQQADFIVQYVVLRKDLWIDQGWPLGSVVAQACHASTAALWQSRDEDHTKQYCSSEAIDSMHKASNILRTSHKTIS